MNYYEHHLGDYLRDTAHLSMTEDGAYRRLLDAYYIAEAPFPDDKRELLKVARAVTKAEREAVDYVLKKFFVYEAGSGWLHSRCEREIARYKAKQSKAKASAEARWGARSEQCERNANASDKHDAQDMRTHSERNANGMHRAPVPRHQSPDTSIPSGDKPPQERPRRASRLPADWALPPEWRDWSRSNRPDLDPAKVAERFRDFWVAKAGKDGAKLDWAATWRNWVRAEAATTGRNNGQSPGAGDVWAGAV